MPTLLSRDESELKSNAFRAKRESVPVAMPEYSKIQMEVAKNQERQSYFMTREPLAHKKYSIDLTEDAKWLEIDQK